MRLRKLLLPVATLLASPALFAEPTTAADDAAARVFCGACAGVTMLIPLVFLAAAVVIAIWIYKDAQRRGDPQAAVWALIGFFFSFVGLIVYIVVRNKNAGNPPSEPPMAPPPPPPIV